jgi:hypothetical protein
MAVVTQAHPSVAKVTANLASAQHLNGITVTGVTIDFGENILLFSVSELADIMQAIGEHATPIVYGELGAAGANILNVIYERDFSGSDYGVGEASTFLVALNDALEAIQDDTGAADLFSGGSIGGVTAMVI